MEVSTILYPTPYRDILILLAGLYPAGLVLTVRHDQRNTARGDNVASNAGCYLGVLVALAGAVYWISPEIFTFSAFPWHRVYLVVLAIPAGFMLEYWVATILYRGRVRGRGFAFSLHESWRSSNSAMVVALVVAVGILEEVIFRQVWISILVRQFPGNMMLAYAGSSLAYAVNHWNFGVSAVISKFLVGLIYSGLFFALGQSFVAPAIVHGVGNLLIVLLSTN